MDAELFRSRFQIDISFKELVYTQEYFCNAYDRVMNREVQLLFSATPATVTTLQKLMDLHHPNVQQVYASVFLELSERTESIQVLVLELANVGTLNQFLKTFPNESSIYLMVRGLIRGMQALNRIEIYGGGFVSSNILVQNDLHDSIEAKVGVYSLLFPGKHPNEIDTAGTPHQNIAPEYAGSELSVSPQGDVWSLGAILFELFTGERPLYSLSQGTYRANFLNLLGVVPEPYRSIIGLALKIDPKERTDMITLEKQVNHLGTPSGNFALIL